MESGIFEKFQQACFNDLIGEAADSEIESSLLFKDEFDGDVCSNNFEYINWLDDPEFNRNDFQIEEFERTYREWENHLTSLRKAQGTEHVAFPEPSTDVNGETTHHLGPDNYEVVEIKVEEEDDGLVEIEDHSKGKRIGETAIARGKKNIAKTSFAKSSDHNYCSGFADAFSVTEEDRCALDKENASVTIDVCPPPVTVISLDRKDSAPSWDKNPKKDSGLESAEVSDASEGPLSLNGFPKVGSEPGDDAAEVKKDAPKKKKLNLDEYRSRRKFTKVISPRKIGTIAEAILTNKWARGSSQVESQKSVDPDRIPNSESDPVDSKTPSEERLRRRRQRSISSSSSESSRSHSRRGRKRSYRSRSKPRNRSRSISSGSSSSRSRSGSSRRSRKRDRSRSSGRYKSRRYSEDRLGEKQKQIEERRVVFVGQLEDSVTKAQLRERFKVFGPIVDVSLHFRDRGDNYGFVTFAHKADAYEAVEHGNDNPLERRYDICFGGRRAFCRQRYADLDSLGPQQYHSYSPYNVPVPRGPISFDDLLRVAQEKLRKQKQVA